MRSQFGLTPAEAQLAINLCGGMDLKEVAETMHITFNTARTHLKRIFSKTHVSRQAELIRLLLQGHETAARTSRTETGGRVFSFSGRGAGRSGK